MRLNFLVLLLAAGVVTGCGPKPHQDQVLDKPLARVNNYIITVRDFQQEAGYLRPVFRTVSPNIPPMMKAAILNDMITRELLLEEAQKLNIDKDAAFMKQVENFWRLSLIKEVWERKTKEFIASIKASDPQIKDADLRQKVQKELESWPDALRKQATIVPYDPALKKLLDQSNSGGRE